MFGPANIRKGHLTSGKLCSGLVWWVQRLLVPPTVVEKERMLSTCVVSHWSVEEEVWWCFPGDTVDFFLFKIQDTLGSHWFFPQDHNPKRTSRLWKSVHMAQTHLRRLQMSTCLLYYPLCSFIVLMSPAWVWNVESNKDKPLNQKVCPNSWLELYDCNGLTNCWSQFSI